ncbi:MAG: M56 family metallopeptidase [Clostridia bacterium]
MRAATIFEFLIEANLMASIAIVLLLPIRRFLRGRLSNGAIYFAWLLVALRLLLPLSLPNPAINEIVPAHNTTSGVRPITAQVRTRALDAVFEASRIYGETPEGELEPRVSKLWSAVRGLAAETDYGHTARGAMHLWMAISACVLGYVVWRNLLFRRALLKGRVEPLADAQWEMYRALCEERGIKPIPVWWVDPLPSACLVGVVRPYIALPLTLRGENLRQALTHELCHHRARDEWWGVLRDLCCVLHWFNPLVWLAAHLSRADCELACDDRVIARYDDEQRLAYANALAVTAARKTAPDMSVLATGMTMKGKHLKQRIGTIVRDRRTQRWLSVLFISLASVALVFAFATAEYNSQPRSGNYDAQHPLPPVAAEGYAPYERVNYENSALDYAKRFLSSDYFNVKTDALTMKVSYVEDIDGWNVEAYPPASAFPYGLCVNRDGVVLNFADTTSDFTSDLCATPSEMGEDDPLVGEYAAYIAEFAKAMLPGVGERYEGMRLVGDQSNAQGRYLTFALFDEDGDVRRDLYTVVLRISPERRVMAFEEVMRGENTMSDKDLRTLEEEKGPWVTWSLQDKAKMSAYDQLGARHHGLPSGEDVTQEAAEQVAREEVMRAFGVSAAELDGMEKQFFFYTEHPETPLWEVRFARDTVWQYAVTFFSRTGMIASCEKRGEDASAMAASSAEPSAEPTAAPTVAPGMLNEQEAVALARKAVQEQCKLEESVVSGLSVYSVDYFDAPIHLNVSTDQPTWLVCLSLGDARSPFDYSVILDAATGEVLMLHDPSNISNG